MRKDKNNINLKKGLTVTRNCVTIHTPAMKNTNTINMDNIDFKFIDTIKERYIDVENDWRFASEVKDEIISIINKLYEKREDIVHNAGLKIVPEKYHEITITHFVYKFKFEKYEIIMRWCYSEKNAYDMCDKCDITENRFLYIYISNLSGRNGFVSNYRTNYYEEPILNRTMYLKAYAVAGILHQHFYISKMEKMKEEVVDCNTTHNGVIIENPDTYIRDAYNSRGTTKQGKFCSCFNDKLINVDVLDKLVSELHEKREEIKKNVWCDGADYLGVDEFACMRNYDYNYDYSDEFNRFISYEFNHGGYEITMCAKYRISKRDIDWSYPNDKKVKQGEIALFIKDKKSGKWVVYINYLTFARSRVKKNANKLEFHMYGNDGKNLAKVGEIEKAFFQYQIKSGKCSYYMDLYGQNWKS